MNRPSSYKTKQSEAILEYIASLGGAPVTAGEIAAHLEKLGAPVGLTTVYRHLCKLEGGGSIRRHVIDGVRGACYGYAGGGGSRDEHFYLKCEGCGEFSHLDCGAADMFRRHILDEHAFQISPVKTVLYGKCGACSRGGGAADGPETAGGAAQ